jgi:hypothetical protein
MPLLRSAARLLTAGTALVLLSAAADAQVRYIASTGKDANNCASPATPCRTLPRGIATTSTGGELRILDSGAYGGGGLINKSMTISGHGEAVMLDGEIKVDAASATVTVRGLSLNGHLVATNGLNILNAAAVHIDNCAFEDFRMVGILAQSPSPMKLFVNDSVSRDNADGIMVLRSTTLVTIDNSRFENNHVYGVYTYGGGTIARSIAAGNKLTGIVFRGGGSIVSSISSNNGEHGYDVGNGVDLESSVARGNAQAGLNEYGSVVSLSNFVATNNGIGIRNDRGTVLTRQNNTVNGNTTNVVGTPPAALQPL